MHRRATSGLAAATALAMACSSAASAPGEAGGGPTARFDGVPASPRTTSATSIRPTVSPATMASAPTGTGRPAGPDAGPVRVTIGDPAATGRLVAVHVIAAVDEGPATDAPTYARQDQRVTLYAAITVERDGKRVVFSDAPAVTLRGRPVKTQPLGDAPRAALTWQRLEPTSANISNGDGPTFHYEPIEYRATPIAASAAAIMADVRPTLTPDHGNGVGTMRYQLAATQGDRTLASPGLESRKSGASGGLTDAVLRVSIRRDDTFLGYMTEMYNQPYIWASAGPSDARHQSEHLEGSDCADLMVYGARRLGKKLAYTWTGGLPQITKKLGAGTRGTDGVYRDAKGTPVAFTRVGDLVLFPRHVGALAEDRGTIGVLDDQDLMMHTLFDSPKEQAIAESGYADTPVEVRRFK